MIVLIGAMTKNRVIGNLGKLPFRQKEDLRMFKSITEGHTVVMGRKTYNTLRKPLHNRKNIILTTKPYVYRGEKERGYDVHFKTDYKNVLELAEKETVYVIGGEQIYELFLPHADMIFLTVVEVFKDGDTHFPLLDMNDWDYVAEPTPYSKDKENEYDMTFYTFKRRQG
jgi:dihydrofolate reductase